MSFSDTIKRLSKYTVDHSPVILTALGVVGTMTTAVLTAKASFKAAETIRAFELEARRSTGDEGYLVNTKKALKLIWPHYLPAIGVGCITVGCILFANTVNTRRAAGMAAAFTLSEKAFVEYKDKVIEKIGENKEREYRDEIAQDRITKSPFNDLFVVGDTSVLCFDKYTGRYFLSSMEDLKKAQNDTNYQVLNDYYASLSDFYNRIGLEPTSFSDEVGWNSDKLLELTFSATIGENQKPCIVIDFAVAPIRDYDRIN